MDFCFYPRHEFACPQIGHCPHLGGAALSTLVDAASEQGQYLDMLHGQLDFERQRSSKLVAENEELKRQLAQVRLELKLERQRKFACGRDAKDAPTEDAPARRANDKTPGKRGAPVGHPGWFRPTPTHYDELIPVDAPAKCPHCGGQVRSFPNFEPHDHLQEDMVDNVHQVVLYRHAAGRCRACRRWVQQAGAGEILGSRLGPRMRAAAMYLRNTIGISYRKVPRALEELFAFSFVPASLIAFEKALAGLSEPLADDIAKKIGSSDGAVHADETYWTLNGERAYYWLHATTEYVHFQFDSSRAGEVSRNVLGDDFTGTLVTDCYSGYHAHQAGAKQKCLAHVARRAHEWQPLTSPGTADHTFFEDVKQWVKRGCELHRRRALKELSPRKLTTEAAWLRDELSRLENCPLAHEKALTLQARLQRHHDEWLVFVDDPRVPPTNNLAERKLRPLVVLRKVTFGHRTEAGAKRMAKIMTVQETAKAHGHKASDFFYYLQTHSTARSLRHLYSGP
ncbi:MAG TPA: IS66 family transposase [Pirellulales bacterium]|nr:IS66 family transposase [Pirellulales bacterium]